LVLQLHKWATVAYTFYQVSCADCYILRVEQFRKTYIRFVILNSKIKRDGVYILRRDSYFLELLNSLTDNSGTKFDCVT